MNKFFRFSAALGLGVVVTSIMFSSHKPVIPLDAINATIEASAGELIGYYSQNPRRYQNDFVGEIIKTSGMVTHISADPDSYAITLGGDPMLSGIGGVSASFIPAESGAINSLKLGDIVNAVCRVSKYSVFNFSAPSLEHCSFI